APAPDAITPAGTISRTPEEAIRDMLAEASRTRGFRMLVTPPELHPKIGRSVAEAIRGTWVSLEEEFFADHGGNITGLERAERFAAQRYQLTDAAKATMERLLEQYGRPGNVVVLGDTGVLGICEALDLPRHVYEETLSGARGFWVLVVPGVIHKN